MRFKWWIVSARVAFVSLIVTAAQNTAGVQTIERGVSQFSTPESNHIADKRGGKNKGATNTTRKQVTNWQVRFTY